MKGYRVRTDWLRLTILCPVFLIGIIVVYFIEGAERIPMILYIIFFLMISAMGLINLIIVNTSKEEHLSRIYLFENYVEIRYKDKVINKINIKSILYILKEEANSNYWYLDLVYKVDGEEKIFTTSYNKNIEKYFVDKGISVVEKNKY